MEEQRKSRPSEVRYAKSELFVHDLDGAAHGIPALSGVNPKVFERRGLSPLSRFFAMAALVTGLLQWVAYFAMQVNEELSPALLCLALPGFPCFVLWAFLFRSERKHATLGEERFGWFALLPTKLMLIFLAGMTVLVYSFGFLMSNFD